MRPQGYLELPRITQSYPELSRLTPEQSDNGPTDRRTDGRTDGRTNGRTDEASYRDAWTHLKMRAGERERNKRIGSIIAISMGGLQGWTGPPKEWKGSHLPPQARIRYNWVGTAPSPPPNPTPQTHGHPPPLSSNYIASHLGDSYNEL